MFMNDVCAAYSSHHLILYCLDGTRVLAFAPRRHYSGRRA
jgi:hypothetical protein